MIHLDTSVLVSALTGPRALLPALRSAISDAERLTMSTVVLYEWLRGPRQPIELRVQEQLCPSSTAVHVDVGAARLAARLYASVSRPRGRETDLLIAACAIVSEAALWTLNEADFEDIPGLRVYRPSS